MEYFAVQERQDSGWVVVAMTTDRQRAHQIKRNKMNAGRFSVEARVIRPHEKVVQAYFLMGNKLWD